MHDPIPLSGPVVTRQVKIVIAGGFGAGKTTFVGAVSDIEAVTTEAMLTSAGASIDDMSLVPAKGATTVAMDFGRVDLDRDLSMYLFGMPGQERFWFMWDELIRGCLGAVVLADVRRLADCFGAIDYFDRARLPYVVVVNQFDDAKQYATSALRDALAIGDAVPLLACDARQRPGVKAVLIELLEHLLQLRQSALRLSAA